MTTKAPPGHHKVRLDEAKVRDMRRLYAKGVGLREIARRQGVSHETARLVVKRLRWRHV